MWQTLICFKTTLTCQQVALLMLVYVNLLKSPTLDWMKRNLAFPLGNWKVHRRTLILWMMSQNILYDIYLLKCAQEPTNREWVRIFVLEYTTNKQPDNVQEKPWFQKVFWLIIYKLSEQWWAFQFSKSSREISLHSSQGGTFEQIYT